MQNLQDRFWIIDLGDVSNYFAMKIDDKLSKKIDSQPTLREFFDGIGDCKPAKIFISPRIANSLTPYKNQE